ncbi:MAG: ZIP family metal transporter [Candidatus Niyogibacteria bacterium CG10_big_fil_rev_8_21_14_0_10_46_36]|uniref:ZIP family metal transporter n=1 Tax=Candidatus Niyogibacteria bacterium CG10_big_fil_rev_8_21_14_0_10_46_36 TaxID=1974726 RepID=A0A2H0TCV2_9BACT|nr:MAG: ZIP family metal transporter [Candidatus Niyogibacteria bacterium CG10_big_fil_rev_8_21_14_0_10_46_36]
METHTFYALISVFAVSLIALIGLIIISIDEKKIRKAVFFLVALAIGALLGDAFLHLIPEALETGGGSPLIPLLVIAGIVFFFIFEKILGWHHHHHEKPTDCEDCQDILPVGRLILLSDGLHNLVDGIIIGASYLISVEVGIATTLAIILHEIPQEIGDFGILIHAGYSKAKALWFNFLSALVAITGVLLVVIFGGTIEPLLPFIIALAAGNFIYIATADLIPELHKQHGTKQSLLEILFILVGIAAMFSLLFFE